MWFAFKLVSLNHWKQLRVPIILPTPVVICFQISIFEPLETTHRCKRTTNVRLWFAFKLVSLNHWKQLPISSGANVLVVICFQISIFDTIGNNLLMQVRLPLLVVICFQISIFDTIGNNCEGYIPLSKRVVICFQISIFDTIGNNAEDELWMYDTVVICFQISIFDTIGNNNGFMHISFGSVVICFQISIFDTIGNN